MRIAATAFALLIAASTFAADAVTGTWKGSSSGPDGQAMEITFNLKAEGTALTGTVLTPMGELPISNGKVDGNAVTFDADAGGMKVSHKCKIDGDTMAVNVSFGDGAPMPPIDYTMKRVVEKK
jgi:hypothetical protein